MLNKTKEFIEKYYSDDNIAYLSLVDKFVASATAEEIDDLLTETVEDIDLLHEVTFSMIYNYAGDTDFMKKYKDNLCSIDDSIYTELCPE